MATSSQVSIVLGRMDKGDKQALAELFSLVYDQLRRKARACMGRERANHTLQATALVNEIYLEMMGAQGTTFKNSAHFFHCAALAMRRYLFDHAKKRNRRAGLLPRVDVESMDAAAVAAAEPNDEAIDHEALDAAMRKLELIDKRRYDVVMLRYYAGLGEQGVADTLGVALKTVQRDWATAKLFLRAEMEKER